MVFYIAPESVEAFKKKAARLTKHFSTPPEIKIEPTTKEVKHTSLDFCDGESAHYRTVVDVCKVTINEVRCGDWTLVANVNFVLNIIEMCDRTLFKSVPKTLGLSYEKCDFCGSTRARNMAHILYNSRSQEWAQVGTECVNKVINGGKYLADFWIKLSEVVKMYGCGEDNFDNWASGRSWDWRYKHEAVSVQLALSIVKMFRDEYGTAWVKSYVSGDGERRGSNKDLTAFYNNHERIKQAQQIDVSDLLAKVRQYVSTLTGGQDYYGEPNLNQKIIDAFLTHEYVRADELYIIWFALDGYEKTLTADSWEAVVSAAPINSKISVTAKLSSWRVDESFYGIVHTAIFEDCDRGCTLEKPCSNRSVIDAFKVGDVYKFTATVKYINHNKRIITLGGRLGKIK